MDVCILAGGKGTRLAGVWDGPKCLVPVGGQPILERLLVKVMAEIFPSHIVVSLGSQTGGLAVINWWWGMDSWWWRCVDFAVEPAPLGRLRALISCLPALTPPILVLNGDTLPRFDLSTLGRLPGMAVLEGSPHWKYAGAFIIDEHACNSLQAYRDTNYELEEVIDCLVEPRIYVPGFLDVGTPAGFAEAQQLTAAEG